MANTIITVALLQKEVNRILDKSASIYPIANQAFTGELKQSWNTVTVQNLPSFNVDLGQTAGNDITAEDWAITSEDMVVDQVFTKNLKIKDLEEIQSNLDLRSKLAWRIAEASARSYDQYVASLSKNALTANKLVNGSPATETTSTAPTTLDSIVQALEEQNVSVGWNVTCFINPAFKALLLGSNVVSWFDRGLDYRLKWEIWTYWGMRLVMTNNLPYKVKFSVPIIPLATDYIEFSIWGTTIRWTFVAANWASWAAQISIWANVAATQVNIWLAFAWTATPINATYSDQTTANRKILRNNLIAISAFASDVAYITSARWIWLTEAITDAWDVFWTPSRTIFACDQNSINFVKQMDWYKVTDAPLWFYSNLLIENAYAGKVFTENAKAIVTKDITNWVTADNWVAKT